MGDWGAGIDGEGGGAEATAMALLRAAPQGRLLVSKLVEQLYASDPWPGAHRAEMKAAGGAKAFLLRCGGLACHFDGLQGAESVSLRRPADAYGGGARQPRVLTVALPERYAGKG